MRFVRLVPVVDDVGEWRKSDFFVSGCCISGVLSLRMVFFGRGYLGVSTRGNLRIEIQWSWFREKLVPDVSLVELSGGEKWIGSCLNCLNCSIERLLFSQQINRNCFTVHVDTLDWRSLPHGFINEWLFFSPSMVTHHLVTKWWDPFYSCTQKSKKKTGMTLPSGPMHRYMWPQPESIHQNKRKQIESEKKQRQLDPGSPLVFLG